MEDLSRTACLEHWRTLILGSWVCVIGPCVQVVKGGGFKVVSIAACAWSGVQGLWHKINEWQAVVTALSALLCLTV
jgi:hypothetical protein